MIRTVWWHDLSVIYNWATLMQPLKMRRQRYRTTQTLSRLVNNSLSWLQWTDNPDFIKVSQRFFIMVVVDNPDFIKVIGTPRLYHGQWMIQTLSRLVKNSDFIKVIVSDSLSWLQWTTQTLSRLLEPRLYQGQSAILYHGYNGQPRLYQGYWKTQTLSKLVSDSLSWLQLTTQTLSRLLEKPDFIKVSQRFVIMVIVDNPDFIKVVGTQTLSRLVDDSDFIKIQ